MKLVNGGRGGGGGGGEGAEKTTAFSFKKCSAFQFVKRKVRRWMRNPKVTTEKAAGKCLPYLPAEDLRCPHSASSRSPYGCRHYAGTPYRAGAAHRDRPEASCDFSQSYDKSKSCKVRKWKMLSRAHGKLKDGVGVPNVHMGCCCQSWGVGVQAPPPFTFAASPVMLECAVCSGPFIGYALDDVWQPRQRTQALDLSYRNESDSYCCPGDNPFMKQRRMGLNDFIQRLATNAYTCKHPEVQSILNLSPAQDAELINASPSPPPSPTQQINLGPSSNPSAKPNDFHFLKVIGKGSFGKVLLARHRQDDRFYAVKVLQKKAILKKKEEKHIMSERNVLLKNVKHPFLVGLHYSFQTADKLYFVLDYINGGELFYHLQRERCFLEPRARFYAAEIASALGYLHSLNIVYRDLKPENILLDSQGHVVLTDFGLCKENIEPNGTTSTFCGTPEYLAPEVLHKQPYDRTVDWWCLGAVLYEMLYGLPPFYSRNTAEMYDNILNKPLQLKANISNAARHLLEGLLQKDRTKRLGCDDDFMEIKKHMFFSPINWDELNAKKITPPFNPNVTGPNDLRHFDPEFTDEPVPNSIGCSPDSALATASIKEAAEAFVGFSYAPAMDSYL
ncbi:serine/threonine-protein kinase Sgk1 isoform X2 [Festucalex cinctus]